MRLTKRMDDSGSMHFWPELALLLWLLFAVLTGAASAQSADPKSPTPLTAGEISGGEIEERASYYFTFEAGPGEVTAALEAKMKKGSKGAGVGVELLDASAKSLASALVSGGLDAGKERIENELFKQLGRLTSAADSLGGGDTKQQTARVKVKTHQPLLLKLTVDKGVESFTLRVGGAVEFAQYAPTAADPAQTSEMNQAMPTQPADPSATPDPSAMPDPAQAAPTPDASTPTANSGGAQPTSGKPAVVLPGKRPALLKVPAKQPQAAAPRPAVVKIPGKKQP